MENNRKICSIVCGGEGAVITDYAEGFVIAADSGFDRCISAGIRPDLIIGDFDSVKAALPNGIEVIKALPEKDDTDTALAAKIAEERGFDELRFFCAFGGRISHSIANLQTLAALNRKGLRAVMFGGRCAVFMLSGRSAEIPRFSGYLSVFSFSGECEISESGVKYPLLRHRLTDTFPLGVSNEITESRAVITVHSGTAAVVLEEE